MADTQTQEQSNEANKRPSGATSDAPSPMPHMDPDAKAEPSGYRGNADTTAGPGGTHVNAPIPDNAEKELNPSAPANTGTTPGTNADRG